MIGWSSATVALPQTNSLATSPPISQPVAAINHSHLVPALRRSHELRADAERQGDHDQ